MSAKHLKVATLDGQAMLPTVDEARTSFEAAERVAAEARHLVNAAIDRWPGAHGNQSFIQDQDRGAIFIAADAALAIQRVNRPTPDYVVAYRNAAAAEGEALTALDQTRETLARAKRREALAGGREELRAAIEAETEAKALAAKASASVTRGKAMLAGAEDRLERAQAAVQEAKQAQTEQMAAAASSGADLAPDQGLRTARVVVADAEDQVAAAREALAMVEAELVLPARQAHEASNRVSEATRQIMLAEIPALKARVVELETERLRVAAVLQFAVEFFDFNNCDHKERIGVENFVERHIAIDDINGAFGTMDASVAPWKAAVNLLKRDADAALPGE